MSSRERFPLGILSYQTEGTFERKEWMPLTEAEIKKSLLARNPDALETLRQEYERYCAAIVRGILSDRLDWGYCCSARFSISF